MEERAESLALEAAREGGKPLVDSRVEVARAIDGMLNCAEVLRSEAGHVIPMNVNAASARRIAFTQREPIGVVVAVSAFNHPLNLIVHQVGPAIAAGCPVIVKPAGDTPLSCLRLVDILREAGLPPGWCEALVTDDTVATQLVSDRRVGFFSFIGSARVGWMLRSKLAPGARCALEHGGAAPAIVAADADLDLAVPKLVKGGFYHAGQVCVSVQRIFAHRSIAQTLGGAHRRAGTPAEGGRSDDARDRCRAADPSCRKSSASTPGCEKRSKAGPRCCAEASRSSTHATSPPCCSSRRPTCRVSTQEVFGPVVCVYAYDELDEAIARANALPVAFQAAVFTRDYATAMRAYERLDASAVMVNDHTAFRVDWMPFSGLRESGLGVGGIPYTFRDMQTEKMFVGPLA